MDLIPVKGKAGFFRDSATGAIVNKNNGEYESYVAVRNKLMSEKKKVENLQSDVINIKSDVDEIKSMLTAITDLLNK